MNKHCDKNNINNKYVKTKNNTIVKEQYVKKYTKNPVSSPKIIIPDNYIKYGDITLRHYEETYNFTCYCNSDYWCQVCDGDFDLFS